METIFYPDAGRHVAWDQSLQCDEGQRIRSITQNMIGSRNDWISFFAVSIVWPDGYFFEDRDTLCGWRIKWKDENNG